MNIIFAERNERVVKYLIYKSGMVPSKREEGYGIMEHDKKARTGPSLLEVLYPSILPTCRVTQLGLSSRWTASSSVTARHLIPVN